MALIKCPECGHEVSKKAVVCPECGMTISSSQKKNGKFARYIWIVGVFAIGVIFGMFSHAVFFDTQKVDDKVALNEQEKNNKKDEQIVSEEQEDNSNLQEQKSSAIKEYATNEPMNITHEYGDYILTVDHVRRSDWLTRMGEEGQPGKVAVLVEMDIQNQTYEDPYNDFMFIDDQIVVLDENNYSIQSWGSGYDDGEYHINPRVPVGTNGKIVIPYVVDETCNTLTITFNNQYKIVAQITD